MKKSLSLTLATPVVFDGQTITTITIERLKGKYARKIKVASDGTMDMGSLMDVAVAALADDKTIGQIKAQFIIDELDGPDLQEVIGYVGEWFAGGQKTGSPA